MDKRKGRVTLSGAVRHIPLILCLVAAGLIIVQLVFAVRYFSDGYPKMTKYADSKVYVAYADGRKVSAVRAVMYPLILRQLARISRPHLLPITYCVQLALTFTASLYFCFALLRGGPGRRFDWHSPRSWLVLLLPLAMLTDPLNLHLDLAVMPDSLTSSMALIFVGSLAFMWSRAAVRYRMVHIVVCLVSFITLSLLRLEKPIVGTGVLAVMFIFSLVMLLRRRDRHYYGRLMILLISILVIGNVAIRAIDRSVPRRKTKDLSMSDVRLVIANRFALEVFDGIYDDLSEETRQHITPELAAKISARRKDFNFFMIPLLKEAPEEGRRILDDMLRTAIRKEGWAVAKYVMEDMCLYLGTPLAFHYHLALKPERRHFSIWTLRNMKRQVETEENPTNYMGWYVNTSGVLVICVLVAVCAIFIGPGRARGWMPPSVSALLIALLFHCMNSFFFAFLTSRFHVRYGLPSYRLVLLTCYVLLFAYVSEKGHGPAVGERPPVALRSSS